MQASLVPWQHEHILRALALPLLLSATLHADIPLMQEHFMVSYVPVLSTLGCDRQLSLDELKLPGQTLGSSILLVLLSAHTDDASL